MFPGRDYHHQLPTIISKLGPIPDYLVAKITSNKLKQVIANVHSEPINYSTVFPDASPLALDLLSRLLEYDASKRITAKEALKHPFLKTYYTHSNHHMSQTASGHSIHPLKRLFEFSFENIKNPLEVKQLLLHEVGLKHPDISDSMPLALQSINF